MNDSKTKKLNAQLRRNIWRSLLIMKSAALSELPAVVTGLTYRKARSLMRELETHGYVGKHTRHSRPEYFQTVDSPSLPAACQCCGRGFEVKVCSPQEKERQTETQREGERQRKKKRNRETVAEVIARAIREVSHDAA